MLAASLQTNQKSKLFRARGSEFRFDSSSASPFNANTWLLYFPCSKSTVGMICLQSASDALKDLHKSLQLKLSSMINRGSTTSNIFFRHESTHSGHRTRIRRL